MTEKLWKLTVFMTDGREKVIALYDDEGEALVDALLLAEDDRLWDTRSNLSNMRVSKMQKYRLDVWMAGSDDWEGYGLHDSYEMAVEEGENSFDSSVAPENSKLLQYKYRIRWKI